MTPAELLQRVSLRGLQARLKRDEVQLQVCPYCGNERWNFDMNVNLGVYRCWACNAGGALTKILRSIVGIDNYIPVRLGEVLAKQRLALTPAANQGFASISILESELAKHYLLRRGFDPELMARDYGLSVCTEKDHLLYKRLVIPVPDLWTGELVGYSGRTLSNQNPKYLHTFSDLRVLGYRADRDEPFVLIEGPFDGLAVHRAGLHAAVLFGVASKDLEAFAARVHVHDAAIVIMLDSTAEAEARRVYAQIKPIHERTVLCLLPNDGGRKLDPGVLHPRTIRALVRDRLRQIEA